MSGRTHSRLNNICPPPILGKTVEVGETSVVLFHVYKAKFLSKSRICNSNNKNDPSSVTFMYMPSLKSYFATSFKSLS